MYVYYWARRFGHIFRIEILLITEANFKNAFCDKVVCLPVILRKMRASLEMNTAVINMLFTSGCKRLTTTVDLQVRGKFAGICLKLHE